MKQIQRTILAFLFLTFTAVPAFSIEYYLRADVTTKVMPDNTVVTMWGFAMDPDFETESGEVTIPGPTLVVPPGDDTLVIHLKNNLTMAKLIYTACPASVVIPGLPAAMTPQRFPEGGMYPQYAGRIRNLTYDTPPGNTTPVDYIWTNVKPGSYIYYSGNHIACHVQMGLYGAVTKNAAANQAYPGISYDQELMLFYSEIDPAFHEAVATGNYGPGKTMSSTMDYHPKYFLVNGSPFVPGQLPISAGSVGQNILVRFFNAGLETHVAQFQNLRGILLAEDGWPLNYQTDQYTFELQALKTKDVLLQPAAAGTYPVYDRRLRFDTSITNGILSPNNITPSNLVAVTPNV